MTVQYAGRGGGDASFNTAVYVTVEIPSVCKRPAAGNAAYRALVLFRNGLGGMEAPDSATLFCRLVQPAGTVLTSRLFADQALLSAFTSSTHTSFPSSAGWLEQATAISAGVIEAFVKVASGDTEQHLTLEVGWVENGVAAQSARRFIVGDAADLDTVASDAATAAAAVGGSSGIGAGTDATVQPGLAGSLHGHLREVQVETDNVVTRIGTIVELNSLVGMIGKGDDVQGTVATAAQSLHSKLRMLMANIQNTGGVATIGSIFGDFAAKSLVARLGSVADVTLTTLAAAIGAGGDAVGTVGTAGQTLHQKLRTALTSIGVPGGFTDLVTMLRPVRNSIVEEATLDGAFVHTTTVIQSSSLDGTADFYGANCQIVIAKAGTAPPRRAVRLISSYDTANKRLTLSTALPWTPVNGDSLVIIPA